MSSYRIDDEIVRQDDPSLQALLASVHVEKKRPICLCRSPGMEMYVSKLDGKYIVKRMPNTGGEHAATCDSYEPPPELSGWFCRINVIDHSISVDFGVFKIRG